MNSFRKLALKKIAASIVSDSNIQPNSQTVKPIFKESGILMDKVKESIKPKNNTCAEFKKKFLTLPPGYERERFIFEEVTKRKILKMVDVTVQEPDGTKITYKAMPDFITICGLRVPMSGQTAQKIADHFNMHIPTPKESRQIWEQADIKIRPHPLSMTGYKDKSGRFWSNKEVVHGRIGLPDAADEYSKRIREEIAKAVKSYKGTPKSVAGHMKDIVVIEGEGKQDRLGLFGWYDPKTGKPIRNSALSAHGTKNHVEYGAGLRLLGDSVTVTKPDGTTKQISMDEYRGPVKKY